MCLAAPGEIIEIKSEDPLWPCATVSFGPVMQQISLALLPLTKVGDFVLVHAGFAIATIDKQKALQVLVDLAALSSPQIRTDAPENLTSEFTKHGLSEMDV